jgi:hypothetical protein
MQALLFLGALAFGHADVDCQSGSCDASDDVSLIQGMLEVSRMQAGASDLRKSSVELNSARKKATTTTAAEATTTKATTTTTEATTTQSYAVEGSEVKLNAAGDLPAFLSAIQLDVGLMLFFVCVFMLLQRRYPTMYAYRWIEQDGAKFDEAKVKDEQGYFGWMGKIFKTPLLIQDKENPSDISVEEKSGLDAAMLLKFVELALELMVAIGVPACLLGIPVFAFAGGGMAKDDRLSWAGIGNVVYNNSAMVNKPMDPKMVEKLPGVQWIYWCVAVAVWIVILYVQRRLSGYQRGFIRARMEWLKRLPAPRSTTVLVQGIENSDNPEDGKKINTDKELKDFFEELFGEGTVKSAFIVKNTGYLNKYIKEYESLRAEIENLEKAPSVEDKSQVIEGKKQELETKLKAIKTEQELVKTDPEYATTNGFVTFNDRKDAEKALGVRLHKSDDTWILETPPAVTDVRYQDFEYTDNQAQTSQFIGYAAVAALFFTFMPIVIGISNLSMAIEDTPFILDFLESTGMKSTVDGTLQTIGLTIMMAMLPTFLAWIFQAFYTLKANRWEQIHIQTYYFWFLVLFVLLTTAVGANLSATLKALATSPFSVFSLLAEMMPVTTHFYLNYVVLQPVTHAMNLTRYIQLIKFLSLKRVCDTEERARELSEPEDQDYYGIGSRSDRFTIMLLIGLVFGTICPLMNVVTFYNFICCRFIYGYLIPYQEKPKDDMGGVHWCMQLHHVQICLAIYLIMMTGILAERCESIGPAVISAISFLWWILAYRRFTRSMQWEKLPYTKMFKEGGGIKESYQQPRADDKTYEQPQLVWTPAKV